MRNILVSVLCVVALAACAAPSGPTAAPPENVPPSALSAPEVETPPPVVASAPAGDVPVPQAKPGKPAPPLPNVVLAALSRGPAGTPLDAADQMVLNRSTQQALESTNTNEALQWQNPDNGHYGSIKPTRTFHPTQTQICREFQQTIVVSGQTQQSYGTACRRLDGSWQLKS
jgi:surface antigen